MRPNWDCDHTDSLVQDCAISITDVLDTLQFSNKQVMSDA